MDELLVNFLNSSQNLGTMYPDCFCFFGFFFFLFFFLAFV